MAFDLLFFFNSLLIGVGLTMDAFSVSLADGFREPKMKARKMLLVAGIFAFFQGLMPMIGWFCVHSIAEYFEIFQKAIPYIALALLSYIGGKMLYEGITKKCDAEDADCGKITCRVLLMQGIATSIDALSVGFTISEYDFLHALVAVLLIALVTLVFCLGGIVLGKKIGTLIANKATIVGGVILIFIGLEIFITGVFF